MSPSPVVHRALHQDDGDAPARTTDLDLVDKIPKSRTLKPNPLHGEEKTPSNQLVAIEVIERRILLIRGHKVMLDSHLAELYEVPTFRQNEAVKRNRRRFPEDFMFQLAREEAEFLISQIAISKPRRGGRRTLPYVFTEQGVAMLATVLNNERAIAVNIAIMRTFVRLRQILATHKQLAERLAAMEKKYDQRFKVVFDILKQLMEPPPDPPKRPLGFVPPQKTY